MNKSNTIKWAQANGVRFVFSRVDGLGKKVFCATNEDRTADGFNLVWQA